MSIVIKFGFIIVIAFLWCFLTYWAWSSIQKVYAIRDLDFGLTLRSIGKTLTKNPFSGLVEQVQERAELRLSWNPQEDYTFSPQGGEVITPEFRQDRRQYLLTITNPGKGSLITVDLRLQFPYPVDQNEVVRTDEADGVSFQPVGMQISVAGSGELKVNRRPLSGNYELRVAEIRPQGHVEILVLLNSWRDPRGKTIPKEELARYFVPEWGPSLTYIHGQFKHPVGSETIVQKFYAPFELREDKTVVMGSVGPVPEQLLVRSGWE